MTRRTCSESEFLDYAEVVEVTVGISRFSKYKKLAKYDHIFLQIPLFKTHFLFRVNFKLSMYFLFDLKPVNFYQDIHIELFY